MNRITSPGRKVKGFLIRVPEQEEGRDTGLGAHDDLAEIESGSDDRRLAGRPSDPEL
jgi:hypothetical protein